MLLLEPEPTPYDLRFRLFGVGVRVHPMFWVFTAILKWSSFTHGGFPYLALWVGCVFVSVLLHELGHVLVGRAFGSHGSIVLYTFGGLAVGSNALPRRWQRVAVLAAGPLVQLVLWIVVVAAAPAVLRQVPPDWRHLTVEALSYLDVINLFWALFNLLPIWPLDGGQISREFFEGAMGYRGTQAALWLSVAVAGLVALDALLAQTGRRFLPDHYPALDMYGAFFFLSLAAGSFQALQAEKARREGWHDRLPWEE